MAEQNNVLCEIKKKKAMPMSMHQHGQGTLFRPDPAIPCEVARQQSLAPFDRITTNVNV
jgi:hypothetical protein